MDEALASSGSKGWMGGVLCSFRGGNGLNNRFQLLLLGSAPFLGNPGSVTVSAAVATHRCAS